jgi:hypothetical protein
VDEVETKPKHIYPSLVVVGVTEAVLSSLNAVALKVQALVAESSVAEAVTVTARLKPLVIVVDGDVHRSHGENFEALARDVAAEVLVVGEQVDVSELEKQLRVRMDRVEARRSARE